MRESVNVTVDDGGKPLTVRITPMSAVKAEAWLMRAALALGGGVAKLQSGMDEKQLLSALLSADYEKVEPLLDDLLTCCERVTEGGGTVRLTKSTADGAIEYPTTLFAIRLCALKATFGFFGNGGWQGFLKSLNGVLNAVQ